MWDLSSQITWLSRFNSEHNLNIESIIHRLENSIESVNNILEVLRTEPNTMFYPAISNFGKLLRELLNIAEKNNSNIINDNNKDKDKSNNVTISVNPENNNIINDNNIINENNIVDSNSGINSISNGIDNIVNQFLYILKHFGGYFGQIIFKWWPQYIVSYIKSFWDGGFFLLFF